MNNIIILPYETFSSFAFYNIFDDDYIGRRLDRVRRSLSQVVVLVINPHDRRLLKQQV